MVKDYLVYIVACSDSRFYIGVTNNLERKLLEYNSGLIKGYTSKRLQVNLVFYQRFLDINQTIKFEI